jgi:hypothetical protein
VRKWKFLFIAIRQVSVVDVVKPTSLLHDVFGACQPFLWSTPESRTCT